MTRRTVSGMATVPALLAVTLCLAADDEPRHRHVALPGSGDAGVVAYDNTTGVVYVARSSDLIAVTPAAGKARITRSFDNSITALTIAEDRKVALVITGGQPGIHLLDLPSSSPVATVDAAPRRPGAVTFDRAADAFVVASDAAGGLLLIDTDGSALGSIAMEAPVNHIVANGRGWIFGSSASSSHVLVADSRTMTARGSFKVDGCERPGDLAIDDVERRLYVACGAGAIVAFDSDTGVVVGRVQIPADGARLALMSPKGRTIRLVAATGDSELHLVTGRITAASATALLTGMGKIAGFDAANERVFSANGSQLLIVDAVDRKGGGQ